MEYESRRSELTRPGGIDMEGHGGNRQVCAAVDCNVVIALHLLVASACASDQSPSPRSSGCREQEGEAARSSAWTSLPQPPTAGNDQRA